MPWAISRDERLARLRQTLAEKGAVQNILVPGTPAHTGLQHEIDAIWAEIKVLEDSWSLNPKAVLIGLLVIIAILWHLAT
ncbi:hypothetical protein [Kitasatospora sp. NPDC059462]|uniref:hypothetical protein n=1 Tax=Kitasatospora sp. NPDC059462 TaxID=3346841 RepID=UPI00367DB184